MSEKNIIWSPAAQKDMETILEYMHANCTRLIIVKFINKVDHIINLASENEKLFPCINADLKIRKCVITKHNTLFYREWDDRLEIVRLFDSRKDPLELIF